MATLAALSRSSLRHSATNSRQTSRMALPLSLRKSAMVLKSGASCPVSQIISILRWHSRSRRRLDWHPIEVAVDVELQQHARDDSRVGPCRGAGRRRSRACRDRARRRTRRPLAPDCPRPRSRPAAPGNSVLCPRSDPSTKRSIDRPSAGIIPQNHISRAEFSHRCAGRPARSRWCKSTTMKE